LSNYSRTVDTVGAVRKVRYGGYEANLHLALSLARNSVFVAANGARLSDPTVTKLIVVVTDNPSADKSATLREAALVRDAGIGLVTIGVGTYLDRYELSAVASFPYSRNMFTINTVRNLTEHSDKVKRIICGGPSRFIRRYGCPLLLLYKFCNEKIGSLVEFYYSMCSVKGG